MMPRDFRNIVPKKFETLCKPGLYNFKVIMGPYYKNPLEEPESSIAFCSIRIGKTYKKIGIRKNVNPTLFECILATGKALVHCPYAERYMRLYKAHEGISSSIDLKFKAIRHALSHSAQALSNPKTIKTLNKLFGSKYINLEKYSHQKVFFSYFFELYKIHDKLLYSKLKVYKDRLKELCHPRLISL